MPRNWKGTDKSTNVATYNHTGQRHAEFMLMTMPNKMFPAITKLMLDSNIMIVYTGATYDTDPHKTGFVSLKYATEEESIQSDSGEK